MPTKSPAENFSPAFLEQRAQVYFYSDQPRKALRDIQEAIDKNPNQKTAWALRGHIYKQLGRWNEAACDFEKVRRHSTDGKAWQECLGRARLKPGGFQETLIEDPERRLLKNLDAALKSNPKFFWLYLWRGELLLRMDRLVEAISDFKAASRIQSKHPWGWLFLGRTQWNAGDYRAALKSLQEYRALVKNPNSHFYIWRAECRFFTGNTTRAEKDFNSAIAGCQKEDLPEFLPWRGTFYLWTGRYEEARKDCEAALAINPNGPYALCWMGAALFKLGRPLEALQYLNRAWEADHHNNETLVWRTEILRTLGRDKDAFRVLKSMLCHCDPRIWLWMNEGLLYCRQNRGDLLDSLCQQFKAYPVLILYLGEIAARLGITGNYLEETGLFRRVAEKALEINLGNRAHPPSLFYFKAIPTALPAKRKPLSEKRVISAFFDF